MKIHRLKIWPGWFIPIIEGRKNFEVRKNDRDYQVGDVLFLEEFSMDTNDYTGRFVVAQVTFYFDCDGVNAGYCVLGINVASGLGNMP